MTSKWHKAVAIADVCIPVAKFWKFANGRNLQDQICSSRLESDLMLSRKELSAANDGQGLCQLARIPPDEDVKDHESTREERKDFCLAFKLA